jgi:hypothetical protein
MSNGNEGFFIPDGDAEYRYERPVIRRYSTLKRKDMLGIVEFHEDDPEEKEHVQYCPHCLKYANVKNRLGPRAYDKDKPVPEDAELWKMCYTFGIIMHFMR